MKSWSMIIPFLAAVYLVSYTQDFSSESQGVVVYFAGNASSLGVDKAFRQAKSLTIFQQDESLFVEFNNLNDLWQRLPESGPYFSAGNKGFSAAVLSAPGQFRRPQTAKALPSFLIPRLENLSFQIPKKRCQTLQSDPATYYCQPSKRSHEIAEQKIGKHVVKLIELSSALYSGGHWDMAGERREVGVYAVHVALELSPKNVLRFTLFTRPSFVQAYFAPEKKPGPLPVQAKK